MEVRVLSWNHDASEAVFFQRIFSMILLCPRVLHRSREGIIRQREERKKTSFLCCSIFGSMYSVLLSLTTGQNIRGLRIDLNIGDTGFEDARTTTTRLTATGSRQSLPPSEFDSDK